MHKTKENQGITLIALVITIIVLSILIGITLYSGTGAIRQTQQNKLFTELGMVQHAVMERYYQYTITQDVNLLIGTEATTVQNIAQSMGVNLLISSPVEIEEKYYELSPIQLKEIGIINTDDTYIVNYKTGEVINKTEETINSLPLYIKGSAGTTMEFDGSDH